MIFLSLFFIYLHINLDATSISVLDLYVTFFFFLLLNLVQVVGIGNRPLDLDSIISIHSIPFILANGFNAQLAGSRDLLISATYSLPLLSILGAIHVLILGISYTIVAKYLATFIVSTFIISLYLLISKLFDKKTALLSILIISSFPQIIDSSALFTNMVLGEVLIALSWLILYWRFLLDNDVRLICLQIIVIFSLVFAHHLTSLVFVVSALTFLIQLHIVTYYDSTVKADKASPFFIILLTLTLMISYYIYVYISPIAIVLNTLMHRVITEAAPAYPIPPSKWDWQVMLQRIAWISFVITSIILSITEIKKDKFLFLRKNHSFLLIQGVILFFFSVLGAFSGAPYSWDRVVTFGWMLFVPATVFLILSSPRIRDKSFQIFIAILLMFVVVSNFNTIPSSMFDHTDEKEYEGSFKNWIKDQEQASISWIIRYNDDNSAIMGDEVVRRLYLANSPNFEGEIVDMDLYNFNFTYLVIRNENFYKIIQSFNDPWRDYKVEVNDYRNISNQSLIYSNSEVSIFENR